ncbi:ketopantoate reductase family protein [Haloplanus aerogenes]|uniref:2-dehydropantoate 2-reductase n=1 Tax=Haloplanus aerogenes TaxID=660522 RepID=A0A3M0E9S9_9EURY|nr:ketopantoate reductase family protein [Haloplanus aerogenes]AZH25295.1 ketopantoate reductase family protein [Haloplanus aerogenes]RMB24990.1 2-dehydropantoate 2-reductase [Haloplanus aerogenes]
MDILVFGAGSLGSLVGGLLARTHDVTLVGRDPHIAAVRRDGLRITGVETLDVSPAATTDATGASADLAVVAVKAYDTETAATVLANGDYDAVLSLQNGMGNEDVLAAHVDAPVLAGTATCGARLADPGHVEWTGRGTITLGPWRPADDAEAAERVAAAFRAADLPTEVAADMRRRLWEKLAINAAINPVTALARVANGALAEPGPLADLARAAAVETATVARADGVDLADETAKDAVATVARETARNRSSMHRDVTRGRRTEIDAINGYVVDRARATGASAPINRTLAALIRGWETGAGVSTPEHE